MVAGAAMTVGGVRKSHCREMQDGTVVGSGGFHQQLEIMVREMIIMMVLMMMMLTMIMIMTMVVLMVMLMTMKNLYINDDTMLPSVTVVGC